MIVEDDRAFAHVLFNKLKKDYRLKLTSTVQECLQALNAIKPDFILLDYYLPDGNGGQLFQQIRERFPEIKIILLSANESREVVRKLINMGVRNYVIKDEKALVEVRRVIEEK